MTELPSETAAPLLPEGDSAPETVSPKRKLSLSLLNKKEGRFARRILEKLEKNRLGQTEKQQESFILRLLERAYSHAVNGLGVMKTVDALAQSYLEAHGQDRFKAADQLIFNQQNKAAVNAFLMNFGGVVALPLTLPGGLLTNLYIQMRMITVMAVIGGYDVRDERVKTLCYVCLTGKNAEKIFTSAGMKVGGKLSAAMLSAYMTKEVAAVLHKALGLQTMTHFSPISLAGSGMVSLGRMLPVAGGFASGAWASFVTRQIGKISKEIFIEEEAEKLSSGQGLAVS